MAFAKKMMGFPSYLISFSTKLPSKRHEKIHVTFFTGRAEKKEKETMRKNVPGILMEIPCHSMPQIDGSFQRN